VREYFGQFVTKQAQSVIDEILAKRMAGGVVGMPGMPGKKKMLHITLAFNSSVSLVCFQTQGMRGKWHAMY
jgi:threonine dehydrogenase-like Zn-dependent dehydrogenase